MGNEKNIYCPSCSRRVSRWDGKATIEIIANCKKCKKRIVFNPRSGNIKIKPIPPRTTSSGMTFY